MYKDACEFKKVYKSGKRAKRGTSWKESVQSYEMRIFRHAAKATKNLKNKTVKAKPFDRFTINSRGKTRHIEAFGIQDRVIHKTINDNSLKPAIVSHIIYDNSATIEGRGNDFAIERLICHLQKHYREHGREGGIALMDFHDYFASIDRDLLQNKLYNIVDEDTVNITCYYTSRFSKGLGVGSELSQISAVYFPTPFDYNAKQNLAIKFYHRYMDDSYMIHESLDYLEYCVDSQTKVANSLSIEINEKHTQIVPLTKPFIFMKKLIYLEENGHVTIHIQPKYYKMHKKKLVAQRKALDEDPTKFKSILDSNQSWFGFANKFETHKKMAKINYMFYDLFRNELDEYFIDLYNNDIKRYKRFFTKNKFMKELVRLAAKYSENEELRDKLSKLRKNPDKYINIYNYTVEEIKID